MFRYERKLESLLKILHRLNQKAGKGVPIIVEGKNDLVALSKLGVKGEVICVKNSSQIIVDVLDSVQSKEVILFVDFDYAGVSLAKDVSRYLEGKSIKVDSVFWRKIGSLVRRDVRDVEGLPSYLEKLKKRIAY